MKTLPFTKADLRLPAAIRKKRRNSISGVQTKVLLARSNRSFALVDSGGDYILKPIPENSMARFANDLPANERLTMQIASSLFAIPTAQNECVRFADGELAYLTRRFDRLNGAPLRQEDLCQIAGRTEETHGSAYKYDFSYEEMADLIRSAVPAAKIELRRVFRQILFNYIFGNADAHLKNFSVLETPFGDYAMSPAYDLLNTLLHYPADMGIMALSMFRDDYMTPEFETLGYYTEADFFRLGESYGCGREDILSLVRLFAKKARQVETMTRASLLSPPAQTEYLRIFSDRLHAFRKIL